MEVMSKARESIFLHMKRVQKAAHIPNSKRWNYSDIPGGNTYNIKGSTTTMKVTTI